MATATTKRPAKAAKPKRARQGFLPSMEPESNATLDAKAEAFHDAETERKRLTQEAKEAGNDLIHEMRMAKLTHYSSPYGWVVNLEGSTKVKVSRSADRGEEAE